MPSRRYAARMAQPDDLETSGGALETQVRRLTGLVQTTRAGRGRRPCAGRGSRP